MNCIIIDDEPLAIKVIQSHLEKIGEMKVRSTFERAVDGFAYLQQEKIDLVFLDIQMPELNGLDFLRSLPTRPLIILCTAYREFASEGFDLDVIDYLVKPVSFNRFLQAISKVYRLQNKMVPKIASTHLPEMPITPAFVYIKSEKSMVRVLLDDIFYLESIKNHVRIFCQSKNVMTLQKISKMEEKLPARHFLRIHRSYIVALNKIDKFTATNITIGDKVLPIGRFYKNEVLHRLQENLI